MIHKFLIAAGVVACASPALAVTTFTENFDSLMLSAADQTTLNTNGYVQIASGTIGVFTIGANGVEIQKGVAGAPQSSPNLVELDVGLNASTVGTTGNSSIFKTIDPGQYTLTYYYSPRPNVDASSNGIAVSLAFPSLSLASLSLDALAQTGGSNTSYVLRTINFTTLTGGDLTFAATGTGDGLGGYIDSIQLQGSAVPEPISWAMMVGGFGLLGSSMRRRKMNHTYA